MLFQVWAPVVVSASLTALVLALLWTPPASSLRGVTSNGGRLSSRPFAHACLALRRLTILVSLIFLNLAAAAYRPLLDPSERWLADRSLFDRDLILRTDGTTEHRPPGEGWIEERGGRKVLRARGPVREVDLGTEHPGSSGGGPSSSGGRYRHAEIGTIVYSIDGSIVAYDGEPGKPRSRPYVIRRPLRSVLAIWWPTFASASITILTIARLWNQGRRRNTAPAAGNSDPM